MTTTLQQPTVSAPAKNHSSGFLLLPSLIGFIFAFRASLPVLWFQDDPAQGSIVSVTLSLSLLIAAALATIGSKPSIPASSFHTPTLRWIAVFLGLNLLSLLWTTAPLDAAASYCAAWVADVASIWFILRDGPAEDQANAIMKGFIWGASLVAVVAWSLPTMPDLRLGDEVLFHPNFIAVICVFGALMALHLAHQNTNWRWPAFWLTLTLIRTISKTSIIAFLVAMVFYLFKETALTRATKIKIAIAGAAILASLSGLLATYLNSYTESYDPSTLTGRTIIWATSWDLGIETPLLGHGFYAYRFVVPAFGTFEAGQAHNELLQQFFALGVLGVLVTIGLYWTMFRQIRHAPRSSMKTLAATVLIFALVHGLTDTEPFDLSYPLWLMAMLSILLAAQTSSQPRPVIATEDRRP
jgi:exopolysaccharide production protein ExoQ